MSMEKHLISKFELSYKNSMLLYDIKSEYQNIDTYYFLFNQSHLADKIFLKKKINFLKNAENFKLREVQCSPFITHLLIYNTDLDITRS